MKIYFIFIIQNNDTAYEYILKIGVVDGALLVSKMYVVGLKSKKQDLMCNYWSIF